MAPLESRAARGDLVRIGKPTEFSSAYEGLVGWIVEIPFVGCLVRLDDGTVARVAQCRVQPVSALELLARAIE